MPDPSTAGSAVSDAPARGALTRLFLANTGANLILRVIAAAMSLWATAWVIEVYGTERFGLFALALQLSGLVGALAPGLAGAYTREIAALAGRGQTAALRAMVRLAGSWLAALGILLGGSLALFAWAGGVGLFRLPAPLIDEGRVIFALAGLLLTLRFAGNVFGDTLAGLQEYPRLAGVRAAAAIGGSVTTLLVARAAEPLWMVLGALAAVRAAEALILAAVTWRRLPAPAGEEPPARELLGSLWRIGAPLALMQLASLIFYQTDHVILGVMVSAEAVTAYHVTARLHNLVREFQGTLGSALMPLVAREAARGNRSAVEQVLYRGTRYHLALVLPVVGTAMIFSGDFLRIWLGAEWQRWALPAAVFVSYWAFAGLTNFPGQSAIAQAQVRRLSAIALVAAVLNLALSVALAPRFGVWGVVAGTLAGYALALPAQFRFVFPPLGIDAGRFLREVVLPVYPAALLAAGLMLALRRWLPPPSGVLTLLAEGAVSAVIFGGLLTLSAWWWPRRTAASSR